jgi:hypothetical protein
MKAELVLAGKSKEQMFDGIKAALDRKELSEPEPGSMCYMMSKDAYLGDPYRNWRPHLMFFLPPTGSPILAFQDKPDRVTVFMITVGKWSDGTAAPPMKDTEK